MPTAHSHPDAEKMFVSDVAYVWPDNDGDSIGLLIEPLYAKQVAAARKDTSLYKLLTLVDMIRVGRSREVNYAVEELKKELQ
ncbi:MAG: hypothetical protein EBZ77_15370 [Chitinophagia bacterium]|nr:hypothetical protein [Chitinophagia bacterium]